MKEVNVKKLHLVRYQFYDILEKENCRQKIDLTSSRVNNDLFIAKSITSYLNFKQCRQLQPASCRSLLLDAVTLPIFFLAIAEL